MKENKKAISAQTDETELVAPEGAKNPASDEKKNEKGEKSPAWKSVLIGGVPGIVLGAAGVLAGNSFSANAEESQPEENNGTSSTTGIHIPADATVASHINDDMSFGEAFAAAREEVGPGGVFTWHGQLYNTYTQEEWAAEHPATPLEPADPVEPADSTATVEQSVPTEQAETTEAAETTEQTETAESNEPGEQTSEDSVSSDSQGDIHLYDSEGNEASVQVEAVYSGTTENGQVINVVEAQVDNHDAAFIDVDNDGYIDAVAVDSNDDGSISPEEVVDTSDSDLHIVDLVSPDDAGIATPEEDIYNQTDDYSNDDYTNDADASAF
ncbi:MAG: hypothetical protein IJ151_00845 [Bacteroidales bacterium]|nr:hypothetical protein [Bacteroidales bacterium]